MRITALLCFLAAAVMLPGAPAAAQEAPEGYVMVKVKMTKRVTRLVANPADQIDRDAIAAYGPFRVLDAARAALVDETDEASPAHFAAMLRNHPGITALHFVECPGTLDDRSNLRLGRMIREAGLDAVVPENGSVRSGAVELVLAGRHLTIEDGAQFAVHAWMDDRGMGAHDYAPDSPEHTKYLAYYREMGLRADVAQRFYAMTNSVDFNDARWLDGAEMRGWLGLDTAADATGQLAAAPALSYDLAL